jgi:hypothetical protein
MTSHPTITLQDLQVLAKNYEQMLPNSYGAFHSALLAYYRSGALQRLAELADRYVDMRDNDRSLEYADHTADRLNGRPTNLDAAIDSARAPSVKEGK